MQNFIVLGIVPGTNLQLTFNFWLLAIAALVGLLAIKRAWRYRDALRVYIVSVQLDWVIDRSQMPA
jgi:hypothetical protein